MLASITPLGERGRRSSWRVTVGAFALGATAAGALLGAALGALGGLLSGSDGAGWRLAVLGGVLALGAGMEIARGGRRLPGPRRQVNEDWLGAWRGWVYGAGFGAQIGAGVLTVVNSAAVYAALVAAALSGTAGRGAVILGAGGLARGAIPLLAAHVRRPDQLTAFHRRFARRARPVARGVLGAEAALVLLALLSL